MGCPVCDKPAGDHAPEEARAHLDQLIGPPVKHGTAVGAIGAPSWTEPCCMPGWFYDCPCEEPASE